jgi:hypothetical protein
LGQPARQTTTIAPESGPGLRFWFEVLKHDKGYHMASGRIGQWIKRAAILVFGVVVAAYAADYLSFSRHFPASRTLISTIKVNVFYLVPHKDGKVEVIESDPESQVCAHTLFSQAGYPPCWRTKNEKWIDLR